MVKKKGIVDFLDKYLKVDDFKDYAANGLQVDGKDSVRRIGFAVDVCLDTINGCIKNKCEMLIVHHGLMWDKVGPIRGQLYERMKLLMLNGVSLYAAHAPLDIHPVVGNNAQLLKMFGLKAKYGFGSDHGLEWGYYDVLKKPMSIDSAKKKISRLNQDTLILEFGKKSIRKIAAVSGGAAFSVTEAVERGIDLLIIGEMKHTRYHEAKEGKLNVFSAGHYATETLGVLALSDILKKRFKVGTTFIDVPTGL
jgi:dinuclear metal center YbgI/SA1388 family protein